MSRNLKFREYRKNNNFEAIIKKIRSIIMFVHSGHSGLNTHSKFQLKNTTKFEFHVQRENSHNNKIKIAILNFLSIALKIYHHNTHTMQRDFIQI